MEEPPLQPGAMPPSAVAPTALPPPLTVAVLTVCSMLAVMMQALDSTIANVALPYMQGTVSASQDEINWVLTSYIVGAAILTTPVGFLAAKFGRTRVFLASVVGFTVASVLCGASSTLSEIVFFRLLQGLSGAALVPLAQAVMFDIYPPEKRGSAMGLWAMGVQIGPIFGPILGGWLTANYSWRWVFYVNVPFGILTFVGLVLFLKETPKESGIRLDWVGLAALSVAIASLQLFLDRGEDLDWFYSNVIIAALVVSVLGFYLFVVQMILAPRPFLPPRLFADRNFVIGVVLIFITGLVLYATLALLAPYLQNLMNYPVYTAGVALAPRGVGTIVAGLVCGRMINLVGPRPLIGMGIIISSYALYRIACWTPDVAEATIISTGVIQGFGLGSIFVPLTVMTFSTLPAALRTQGAGVYSLLRNIGSSVGISITSALLVSNTQVNHEIIGASVTPFNRMLQSGAPMRFWNPGSAGGAAALNGEITRQANIIGYINDFKLMMVLSIVTFPLIFLIRSANKPAGRPAR